VGILIPLNLSIAKPSHLVSLPKEPIHLFLIWI